MVYLLLVLGPCKTGNSELQPSALLESRGSSSPPCVGSDTRVDKRAIVYNRWDGTGGGGGCWGGQDWAAPCSEARYNSTLKYRAISGDHRAGKARSAGDTEARSRDSSAGEDRPEIRLPSGSIDVSS